MINQSAKFLTITLGLLLSASLWLVPSKKTFAAQDESIRALTEQEISRGITQLLDTNEPLELNIYFATDSFEVKAEYQLMLHHLNKILAEIDLYEFKLNLIGHTDSRASKAYNLRLGKQRADAVQQLLAPGLTDKIKITGLESKGKDAPVADNSTDLGKALNRRVEIRVVPSELEIIKENNKVELSGGGESLLINEGRQLVLWDTDAQCPQNLLHSDHEKIITSSISPNKLMALSGGDSQKLTLWDINTASKMAELTGHTAPITALEFAQNNKMAISGALDAEIRIWDLIYLKEVNRLTEHTSAITAVALSEDGKYAASGDIEGNLILWDIVAFRKLKQVQVHNGPVLSISFNLIDNQVLSSSPGSGLYFMDIHNYKGEFLNDENVVQQFDVSSDGQQLATAYNNGDIKIWQTRNRRTSLTIKNKDIKFVSLAFTSQDQLIMASDKHNNMHFWDAQTGSYLHKFATKNWQEQSEFPAKGEYNGESFFDDKTEMEFTWVEGACFEMGCGPWNENCSTSETPVHQVCLDGYWMGVNEVNQEQWLKFADYNPSSKQRNQCIDDDCAVNQVSWSDAQLFMCKLNRQAGQIYRLPTEAEWEYACRDNGRNVQMANTADREEDPDEEFENMNDGVWEWTLDAFDKASYSQHRRHNPVYPGNNSYHFMQGNIYRALRGGAWDKGSETGQCSRRYYDEPKARNFFTGFRVVKPIQ